MIEDVRPMKMEADKAATTPAENALFDSAYGDDKTRRVQVAASDELAAWTREKINQGLLNGLLAPLWTKQDDSVGGGVLRTLNKGKA